MSEDPVTIPIPSDLTLREVDYLRELHARGFGLQISHVGSNVAVGWGALLEGVSPPKRLVTELLHLAQFALLVREIAECRPSDAVVDVVTQVHDELRRR